ncbi:chemotaxis protein CheW [Parapedomonas caeni]|jgi:purine-binding chemotaxis protein CheW
MTLSNIDGALQVLTIDLNGETFALEAGLVREILDTVHVTDVPGADPFVSGLINVRGRVVPLADPRLRFGMNAAAATIDSRFVVIEIDLDGDPTTIALRADKVHEVTELPVETLEATPAIGMKWRPEYIRCVGKRGEDFVIVLDIERVLTGQLLPDMALH